ncbi:Error-prone, lesion bypass DNA polymerase V (UmuC) [Acinetobacter bereziniae]|uniref:Y-family DNA polymerase n=1 Tax=Acinetobacter bereziniae TaxID=106648 RepID=UPI000573404C|nr:Y-family DNA polymerase [Acinetobacter bereziniae]CEI54456.1 Error-prone, lesion bypass DNA polymerase V (UmuC) [Acinetobacter bereziniae]
MKEKIIALIDINNCYVSCERLFQPNLNNRPVIVLSNNDGCAVARSQEAKDLGIKMGVPLFQIKDIVEKHNVVVLSSNYAVYEEMSNRFTRTIKTFVSEKDVEVYSIDETFVELTSYKNQDLNLLVQNIKDALLKWLGLPVCIGIGRSKTEAKIANHIAKKNKYLNGICNLHEMDPCSKETLFQQIDVSEVWGVGRKHSKKLHSLNIKSVFDLAIADPAFIQSQFSVVMKRTVLELQGTACIELEEVPPDKKQIVSSRSFGQRVTDKDALSEAMSSYIQNAVKKLRRQNGLTGCVIAFAHSNPFDTKRPFYKASVSVSFPEPTDSAAQIIKSVLRQIDKVFKEGVEFKKCGVILTCIESKSRYVPDLLADYDLIERNENLQSVLEQVDEKFGKKLAIGPCLLKDRTWSMSREKLTQNYFSWDGLLEVG